MAFIYILLLSVDRILQQRVILLHACYHRSDSRWFRVVQEELRRTRNCAAESDLSPPSRRRRAEKYFGER